MALGSIQAETCELFTSLWKVCSQNCYHNTAVTWPNPHPKRNTTASMPTIDRLPAIIVSQCHMAYINIRKQVLFLTETASCLAVMLLKLASWTDWIYSDTVNQRQLICALQDNTVTYKQLHVPKWRPMYTILRSFGLTPPCQMAEECGRSVSENVGRSRCSTLWAQNIHRVARVKNDHCRWPADQWFSRFFFVRRRRRKQHLDTNSGSQEFDRRRRLYLSTALLLLRPVSTTTQVSRYRVMPQWEMMDDDSQNSRTRVCLFVCLGFNGTFSTNRLYCAITVG